MPGRAQVLPTFLIDGRVHGSWSLSGGHLWLTPFRPLPADDQATLEKEARRLLPFVAAQSVSFATPP